MTTVTIKDVAKAAGVGAATVDRVVNRRGNPSADTIARVEKAVTKLGYRPNLAAASLRKGRRIRIGVVLPDTIGYLSTFIDNVTMIDEEFAAKGVAVELIVAETTDPVVFAKFILDAGDRLDGMLILAPSDPAVNEAVTQLEGRGVRIAAIVSDLPTSNRSMFCGPNNTEMGSTAGQIILPTVAGRTGKIVVTKIETLQDDVEARHLACCKVLYNAGIPYDRIATVSKVHSQTQSELVQLLSETGQPDEIDAIYMTGGRTGEIAEAASTYLNRKPLIVATDLTPISRDLILDRTIDFIVASDGARQLRVGVSDLIRCITERTWQARNTETQIDVYTRFNLPRVGVAGKL